MLKVYGQSDDLVVIEGDIEQEYDIIEEPKEIILSNGMIIHVQYSPPNYDNRWKIQVIKNINKHCKLELAQDEEDNYTDILYINEPIEWCILNIDSIYELRDYLRDNLEWDTLEDETLKDLYIKYCKTSTKEKV